MGTDPGPLLVGTGTVWAPTWVPDGLEMWDLQVSPVPDWFEAPELSPDLPPVTQLVGVRWRAAARS